MELVIAGLGRMGANMARRLHRAGHRVVAYNRSVDKTHEIMGEGLDGADTPEQAVAMLSAPRIVWLMVPAAVVAPCPTRFRLAARAEQEAPAEPAAQGEPAAAALDRANYGTTAC